MKVLLEIGVHSVQLHNEMFSQIRIFLIYGMNVSFIIILGLIDMIQ